MAILDQNGVPILALGQDTRALVDEAHASGELLTGHTALLHNRLPINPPADGGADVVVFHIGGETLDEAAKSIVGTFDSAFGHRPPATLACTHEQLAAVLAEHYEAQVLPVEELVP